MGKFSIVGPGYTGRSSNINTSRCVNFYPETNPSDSKSPASLIGTPGLSLYIDTLLGPIRGSHFFNNLIYFVSSNKLYSVDSAKNLFPVIDSGTGHQIELATTEGRVSMADNGIYSVGGGVANQLAFVDGQNVYVVNVSTLVFTSFAVPAKSVTFIGGYFMLDTGGAGVAISNLYDGTTWPALAASTADTYPDNLQTIVNNHNEAWMVGDYSVEIWAADGSSNPFPFSRVSVIDYGTAAPHSVAKGNNTLFLLATQRNGNAGELFGIGMVNGYGVDIVSPQSINFHISKYTVVSDAWGFCYTDKGHEFYMLTFPTENATWVYDSTTGQCHERSYYSGDPYKINRHLANTYVYAWGKHFVGSYIDGKIYEMSEDYLTDDGQPIASVKTSPPLDGEEGRLFISKLQIDAETGLGLEDENVTELVEQYRFDADDFALGYDLKNDPDWQYNQTAGDAGQGLIVAGQSLELEALIGTDWTYSYEGDGSAEWHNPVIDFDIVDASGNIEFGFVLTTAGKGLLIINNGDGTWQSRITRGTKEDPSVSSYGLSVRLLSQPTHCKIVVTATAYNVYYNGSSIATHSEPTAEHAGTIAIGCATLTSWKVNNIVVSVPITTRVTPKMLLSWSDDSGHTWSNDRIASMGYLGEYQTKVIFRKLGMSKNRSFRIAITDAVKKVLIGSYMDYKRGRP